MRDPQRLASIGQDNTETCRRPLIRESRVIRNRIKRGRINELALGTVTAAIVQVSSSLLSWGDLKREITDCVLPVRRLCPLMFGNLQEFR
jgi:hypothetical protein